MLSLYRSRDLPPICDPRRAVRGISKASFVPPSLICTCSEADNVEESSRRGLTSATLAELSPAVRRFDEPRRHAQRDDSITLSVRPGARLFAPSIRLPDPSCIAVRVLCSLPDWLQSAAFAETHFEAAAVEVRLTRVTIIRHVFIRFVHRPIWHSADVLEACTYGHTDCPGIPEGTTKREMKPVVQPSCRLRQASGRCGKHRAKHNCLNSTMTVIIPRAVRFEASGERESPDQPAAVPSGKEIPPFAGNLTSFRAKNKFSTATFEVIKAGGRQLRTMISSTTVDLPRCGPRV